MKKVTQGGMMIIKNMYKLKSLQIARDAHRPSPFRSLQRTDGHEVKEGTRPLGQFPIPSTAIERYSIVAT